ncbi:MAG: ABC transporter ATP-binding protein [Flavobacteriaceae bacterium]|nr:ABC transporter ATP-binding protein [Flavobacteriaceae bacterium]
MLKVAISSFSYTEDDILKEISFCLQKGEHLAVLGESGCGKSTLLHIIYGLLHLENGSLTWDEKPLLGPNHNLIPGEPFMKLVAQEFNVMPFITVSENIATHLNRLDAESDLERVEELIRVVDLEEHKDRMVKDLSGGQKQRVALAKALAKEPELLLLDEPFSHIDSFRKNKLRRKLYGYLKEKNIACITATHDSEEALAFSDQLLILHQGGVEAMGTPKEIYTHISSRYQGSFFGEVNELPASLFPDDATKPVLYLLPHQLGISKTETPLLVEVMGSYYKGNHYLIASVWNGKEVFFVSSVKLKTASQVYLKRI